MSSIKETFEFAIEDIKNLKNKPSNDDLLYLYGYYKQATHGDCDTSQPSLLDFTGRSKWNAWYSLKGTSEEDAMTAYCDKYLELMENDE
jgi:diazepam-binding inhibitor (GABA receptor modulating acyl-CoA-binding protein)